MHWREIHNLWIDCVIVVRRLSNEKQQNEQLAHNLGNLNPKQHLLKLKKTKTIHDPRSCFNFATKPAPDRVICPASFRMSCESKSSSRILFKPRGNSVWNGSDRASTNTTLIFSKLHANESLSHDCKVLFSFRVLVLAFCILIARVHSIKGLTIATGGALFARTFHYGVDY